MCTTRWTANADCRELRSQQPARLCFTWIKWSAQVSSDLQVKGTRHTAGHAAGRHGLETRRASSRLSTLAWMKAPLCRRPRKSVSCPWYARTRSSHRNTSSTTSACACAGTRRAWKVFEAEQRGLLTKTPVNGANRAQPWSRRSGERVCIFRTPGSTTDSKYIPVEQSLLHCC